MTQRNPSIVPFAILFVVALVLVPYLPRAVAHSNAYWAAALLVTVVFLASCFLVITRSLQLFSNCIVAALWLIPAMVLSVQFNPLALLCVVPLLFALCDSLPGRESPRDYAFLSTLLLQTAFVVHVTGRPLWGLIPMSLGVGLILWAKEPAFPPRNRRLLSGLIAVLLTFFLLRPAEPLVAGGVARKTTPIAPPPKTNEAGTSSNAHLGIILRPEVKAQERKLPPPQLLTARARNIPSVPIDIPFSGVYWLYQTPLVAPPANSPVILGSPGEGKYRSDDETPLRMEARQSFSLPFPARRLSQIEVTLLSNDMYPSTLWLELIAVNSETGQYRMSFGRKPIEFLPAPQTIGFNMPVSPVLDEFDQLLLRVHLTPPRLFIAPRVTIQKVPAPSTIRARR